jgi:hypothetical protein
MLPKATTVLADRYVPFRKAIPSDHLCYASKSTLKDSPTSQTSYA